MTDLEKTVIKEATFVGLDVANALRPGRDVSDTEAGDLAKDGSLYQAWTARCEKNGWGADQRILGWTTVVDAYYDRMTGAR